MTHSLRTAVESWQQVYANIIQAGQLAGDYAANIKVLAHHEAMDMEMAELYTWLLRLSNMPQAQEHKSILEAWERMLFQKLKDKGTWQVVESFLKIENLNFRRFCRFGMLFGKVLSPFKA